ncbi:MAG: TetR/AcrR family transcriptional regulator [Chloroflexi bacterium]|nr:TetR/AcrR family transcriptional regulator [Chloroflexota bacterium]
MPRPKKTEEEIQAMREKILDVTLAIVKEDGPDAITSRAIAKRLGVSHMSLFTYFENQAAIISALRNQMLSNWSSVFEKIKERALTEDIPPLVKELLGMLVTYAKDNPNIYRMGWVVPEEGNQYLEEGQQKKLIAADLLANLLKLGMERGDFAERDPLLAATTTLGMVNVPFILFHTGRIDDPVFRDRMVDEVLSAAMQYLGSK